MSQRTESDREPQTAGLSVTQILASALAAVTTTWALSYLGVAGTVIGAGLASIVTVLGNHLYAHSIERTRHQVRTYRPSRYAASARSAQITPTVGLEVQDPTQPVPAITQEVPLLSPEDGAAEDGAPHVGAAEDGAVEDGAAEDGPPGDTRRSRRPLVVSIVVVFLLIMAAVTAFEILNGRSLSDTVRGTQGSGTTIFGGTGSTAPVPTPTGTSTSTPTASSTSTGTTPAVTSTTTTITETSTSPASSPSSTTPPEVTLTSTPPSVSATP